MRIRTKCVYDPKTGDDGLRVLVTRYWPRGVKKDRQDAWFRELGPEPELIRLWKSGMMEWNAFRKAYIGEHRGEVKKKAFKELREMIENAGDSTITLLCTCREEARCHRALLKKMLER